MAVPKLTSVESRGRVWRVGFLPEPWAWSGWEWASNGRFSGRWDDANGNFRTVYAGATLLACLLEVLAHFRTDALLATELDEIEEDEADRARYPSLSPGQVPREWLEKRTATSAALKGSYCAVTTSASVAALHPYFIGLALSLKLTDFDTAALKDANPRILTQTVATYLYATTDFNGVRFASRHGDDLELWAIFERPGDPPISPAIDTVTDHPLRADGSEIAEALGVLGLRWSG